MVVNDLFLHQNLFHHQIHYHVMLHLQIHHHYQIVYVMLLKVTKNILWYIQYHDVFHKDHVVQICRTRGTVAKCGKYILWQMWKNITMNHLVDMGNYPDFKII